VARVISLFTDKVNHNFFGILGTPFNHPALPKSYGAAGKLDTNLAVTGRI
jgi:hypothetical protein